MGVIRLDPRNYSSSFLHDGDRDWRESNCYVDLWIELLSALELDARACLGFTIPIGFEGDQWTFHKPDMEDLRVLYGIVVEEMLIWKSVIDHCVTQVDRGNLPLVEVDAYFLPDTVLSNYQSRHGKTSIAVNSIDPSSRNLGYFHNAGYFELNGRDFDGLFRLDRSTPADYLSPYCEVIKVDRLMRRSERKLRSLSRELLTKHVLKAPSSNPFRAFLDSLEQTVAWLTEQTPEAYHDYMFATLRQCGSAYELASRYLTWIGADHANQFSGVAEDFDLISKVAKRLVMKIARAVAMRKATDLTADVSEMAIAWDRAYETLEIGVA